MVLSWSFHPASLTTRQWRFRSCLSLHCYLSKSLMFARILNMFSRRHLRELIDIGLACCEQRGKNAASTFGKLVAMRA